VKLVVSVALSGLVMYGFTHPSLIYLLEQLPGASRCHLYEFRYHREQAVSALVDDDYVSYLQPIYVHVSCITLKISTSPVTSTLPRLRCDVGLEVMLVWRMRSNSLYATVLCTIVMDGQKFTRK